MNEIEQSAQRYAMERTNAPDFPIYNDEYELTNAYIEGAKTVIYAVKVKLSELAKNHQAVFAWSNIRDLIEELEKE